jgi:hypothetical protein
MAQQDLPVALKSLKNGSDLVVAAAGIAQQFRITRHDRRSAPAIGGWRGV